jgi:hypothetical protein
VDGRTWTRIDSKSDRDEFIARPTEVSFPLSSPADFRFIRITQTATNGEYQNYLFLYAVEFFGTLTE